MTSREYFAQVVGTEAAIFERVFRALPADKLDYKPHERSKSAKELLFSMAVEAKTFQTFLETGVIDHAAMQALMPKDVHEAIAVFASGIMKAKEIAMGMSEDAWLEKSAMVMGGNPMWETTKGEMAWGLLLDLIHHRGQLSVYIRLMGGKVPSIYGPSADSNG